MPHKAFIGAIVERRTFLITAKTATGHYILGWIAYLVRVNILRKLYILVFRTSHCKGLPDDKDWKISLMTFTQTAKTWKHYRRIRLVCNTKRKAIQTQVHLWFEPRFCPWIILFKYNELAGLTWALLSFPIMCIHSGQPQVTKPQVKHTFKEWLKIPLLAVRIARGEEDFKLKKTTTKGKAWASSNMFLQL